MEQGFTMKLGDFLKEFEGVSPDTDIVFGSGNLKFYRTKWRGDTLLQIEFDKNTWPSVFSAEEMAKAREVNLFIP